MIWKQIWERPVSVRCRPVTNLSEIMSFWNQWRKHVDEYWQIIFHTTHLVGVLDSLDLVSDRRVIGCQKIPSEI